MIRKGIIDRFEGDIAVVEVGGSTQNFPRTLFPKTASVGDVIQIENTRIIVLENETEKLKKEIEDLMDEVWDD